MNTNTNQNVSSETLRCIYCKKVLDESASFFELEEQVHISCKLQIEDYRENRGKLPKEVFKELQSFFREFNITQYRYHKNKELFNARTLNLNDKNITYLPKEIKYLTNLKTLAVARNKLQELPAELGQMVQLRVVNLSYNKFDEIPKVIGDLPYIQRFMYAGNKVEKFPRILQGFRYLEELDLSDNKLREIPESIGDIQSLQGFYGYLNKLTEVPEGLRKIKGLQMLHLGNNKIQELPDWIVERHYNYVNLTDNPIPDIEAKLKKLQSMMLNRVVLQSEIDDVRKRMGIR